MLLVNEYFSLLRNALGYSVFIDGNGFMLVLKCVKDAFHQFVVFQV